MSVEILEDGNGEKAVLIDSGSGFAFGPVFEGYARLKIRNGVCLDASTVASCFLRLAVERHGDPRRMHDHEMTKLALEVRRKLEVDLPHGTDDHCMFDEEGKVCVVCLAPRHRYPCSQCNGHVYHYPACPDGSGKIEE